MRRIVVILTSLLALASGVESAQHPVQIPDPALKAAIAKRLGVTDPNATDMLRLTHLGAPNAGIANLSGLEYAENLEILSLSQNACFGYD